MKFMTLPGHNDLAYEGDHVFNIFVGKVIIFVAKVNFAGGQGQNFRGRGNGRYPRPLGWSLGFVRVRAIGFVL